MQNLLKFEQYGKIIWLWSNSELHKSWPTHLQSRFVLPAILHNQYYILKEGTLPVAYCSWAFLNIENEKKYLLNPNSLEPEDWNSGDRLWFIEYISPFSPKYTRKLKSELASIFPDSIARSVRVWDGNNKAHVSHYKGTNVSSESYRKVRSQYFQDIHEVLQNDVNFKNRVRLSVG